MNLYLRKPITPRVLLLFSSSELGGTERSLTRMTLVPANIEYHLATLDGEGPWCDWVRMLGCSPVVFGQRHVENRHGRYGWKAIVSLIRYVHREKIDVIYICGFRVAFILRWIRFLLANVQLVQGIRWNPDSKSSLDLAFRFVERWSHSLVACYITNSQAAAETLIRRCKIPKSRIQVIHNGLSEYPEDTPPLALRPLEILTVANLNPRKGHREYLKVIHLVLEDVPDAQFVFVGRDDMNGEIQRVIESEGLSHAVRCEGFQSDVSSYFRRSRIFVLPSLWGEGSPTSLLESLSWGVPVVAYNIDGVSELINDEVDGFVVRHDDKKSLAHCIITLLNNVDLSSRYGQEGRKKVLKEFSLEQCSNAHLKCLKGLFIKNK